MYKYSIIVPVYNANITIERTIESVLNQSYNNFELIIVDDGSEDDTLDKINGFKDQRIKIYCQKNMGPGLARNLGIKKATGDYIAFLDADDYLSKTFLESVDQINCHSKKDLIYVDCLNENENGFVYAASNVVSYRSNTKNQLIKKQIAGIIPLGAVVKVVLSCIAKRCFFEDIQVGEEAVFSFDVLLKSKQIGFVEKPQYHYVYNKKGQHNKGGTDPWGPVVKLIKMRVKEKNLYNEYKEAVNSLAINALCISAYRCASRYSIKRAIYEIDQAYENYSHEYELNLYERSLLFRTSRIALFFLNRHMYYAVWLASCIRKIIK